MSTTAAQIESRILNEGYGPGAWHGPDLKAALGDVALDGEDWFDEVVAAVEPGAATSPLAEGERFNLVLGIACHAVYHAGQVQLVKRLLAS
jgi:hypothetical protein